MSEEPCAACGSTAHRGAMCPSELQVVKQEHGEHGRHCAGCRELGYLTEIAELRSRLSASAQPQEDT